jgi:hypothetical protein
MQTKSRYWDTDCFALLKLAHYTPLRHQDQIAESARILGLATEHAPSEACEGPSTNVADSFTNLGAGAQAVAQYQQAVGLFEKVRAPRCAPARGLLTRLRVQPRQLTAIQSTKRPKQTTSP